MNERLGFQHLDTATRLVINLPRVGHGTGVTDDPAVLEEVLVGTTRPSIATIGGQPPSATCSSRTVASTPT